MPRMPRVMFGGAPFHITHRGNHKKNVFDGDRDRRLYLRLLGRYAERFELSIWGYCLMDNHVHLLAVGRRGDSIPRTLGNAHREYSRLRNLEAGVTGHLWANRFFSTVLDETHLWAAIRYVELNPVRASMVREATAYAWSSARAHAGLGEDALLDAGRPFPGPIGDWRGWLASGLEDGTLRRLRENTASGAPTGGEEFVCAIERRLNRRVRPRRRRGGAIPAS